MTGLHPRLLALALAAGVAAGGAVLPDARAAEGPSVLRVARGLPANDIAVLENRALVIESAVPFVEVSVAQPQIADVSPLSDRAIYVFGRSRGVTSLTLLGEGGTLIANVAVQVTPDLAGLAAAIDALDAR